jgi:hypothetical protein
MTRKVAKDTNVIGQTGLFLLGKSVPADLHDAAPVVAAETQWKTWWIIS